VAGLGWIVLATPAMGQEGTVAGRVLDAATQQPLIGAQVVVDGTSLGTVTDVRGRFQIRGVSGESVTLRVVMIGYRTATRVARAGDSDIEILMSETALALDQIVVTGTPGGTRTRAIGNSVGRVSAGEVVEVAPVASTQNLLSGRVPGLVIMPASGNVGTGGVTRVRGVSTLSLTNEPLIYIDGVRVNNDPRAGPNIRQGRQVNRLNDLNPEDIESIEVIKGPAAATLYGTEASNGVIQIITKKGAQGSPSLDVMVRQGATWLMSPESRIEPVYSRDPATGQLQVLDLLAQERGAGRPIFQSGRLQSYSLALRGGRDDIRYYLSGDYDDNEGIVSYNWERKFSTRANLSITPSEVIDLNASVGWIQGRTRFAQAASGWGIWDQIVWGSPLSQNGPTRGFLRATPEAVGEIESYSDVSRFTGSLTVQFRATDWLTQRLVVGTDVTAEQNSILFPRHPDGTAYFFGALSLGQRELEERRSIFNTIDYSVTAERGLTPRLRSATSFGFQYYTKRFEIAEALGQEFPAPSVTTIGGAAVTSASEDLIENKTVGVYVQQQFNLADRLFLTGAIRGDDNSAFGENFSAVVYPKLSATWVVNEEPFWTIDQVTELKLRAAWGRAGQQPDVFAAIRLYQPATGPGDGSVLTPQSIGNPDLEPEKGEEIELGFDAGLFEHRLTVSFTHYRQRTRDAILEKQVSPSVGFPGFQFVNLGEISNKGIELALSGRVVDREAVSLDLGLNYATNSSRIESLGGLPPIGLGVQEHREGYPIGAFFTKRVVSAELDSEGRATNIMCDGGPENNGAPVPCADAPRVYWGVPTPTWEGSANATLNLFNRLRLYALVEFRGGHMIENGDIRAAHLTFRNSRAINEATDPILLAYDQLGITNPAGFFDAGFAKLREVSATYTLPNAWVRRLGASRASVTVAGRNLATLWVAQKEIFGHRIPDPEIRTPGSELSGYVQTVIPPLSQVMTTVRLTF
jgi:TonB-dependent SusC/RagA subfamily outer membrane receptor